MTQTKPESSPRRRRLERADVPAFPLSAIERGPDMLRLLDALLYLSNDQIETALFRTGTTVSGKARAPKGAAYAANTALRRLFDAGYVDRTPLFLPGNAPHTVTPHYVNVLSTKGARMAASLLKDEGRIPRWRRTLLPHPWQPLLHGYWIRQFAVSSQAACAELGWRWWSWFDDRQLAALKQRHGATFGSVPDGFFMITNPETGKDFPHFLEIDLGTETVDARTRDRRDWRGKVESYLTYVNGKFREEFGVESLPIILTVTESEQRLAHLLAATAATGGGGRFWFTTLDRLLRSAAMTDHNRNALAAAREPVFWDPVWRVPTSPSWRNLATRIGAFAGRKNGEETGGQRVSQ